MRGFIVGFELFVVPCGPAILFNQKEQEHAWFKYPCGDNDMK